MSRFALRQNPTQPVSSVTMRIGEESQKIVLVAESGDSGAQLVFFDFDSGAFSFQELTDPYLDPQRNRVFTLDGLTAGTFQLVAFSVETPKGPSKVWGTLGVIIEDANESGVDLFYFGKHLVWRRSLPPSVVFSSAMIYAATSGNSPWSANLQGMSDSGPVPEGLYSFVATLDPLQASPDQATRRGQSAIDNRRDGLQFLPVKPDGSADNDQWGTMRVKLDIIRFQSTWFTAGGAFNAPKTGFNRFGFYLHNSHKGFSHGCIECGANNAKRFFFSDLLSYAISNAAQTKPRLQMRVAYRDRDTQTKGDTEF